MDIIIRIKSLSPMWRHNPDKTMSLEDAHKILSESLADIVGDTLDNCEFIVWDNDEFMIDVDTTRGGDPVGFKKQN